MLLLSVFINVNVLLQKALLIEVFRQLINTQNNGHQDSILGGLFSFVRVSKNFAFRPISHAPSNAVGFIRTLLLPFVATRCTQKPFLNIRVNKKAVEEHPLPVVLGQVLFY
jgi:hypothetical protein